MPALPTPNFEGFADAQRRHRQNFGHDIVFKKPGSDPVWPVGTPIDPESGQPFDPTIEPTSGGEQVETTVRCNVISRPMGLSQHGIDPSTSNQAIGFVEEGGVVLIVNTEDKAALEGVTEFEYAGERYEVRETDDDFLGPVQRYLVWGRQDS